MEKDIKILPNEIISGILRFLLDEDYCNVREANKLFLVDNETTIQQRKKEYESIIKIGGEKLKKFRFGENTTEKLNESNILIFGGRSTGKTSLLNEIKTKTKSLHTVVDGDYCKLAELMNLRRSDSIPRSKDNGKFFLLTSQGIYNLDTTNFTHFNYFFIFNTLPDFDIQRLKARGILHENIVKILLNLERYVCFVIERTNDGMKYWWYESHKEYSP